MRSIILLLALGAAACGAPSSQSPSEPSPSQTPAATSPEPIRSIDSRLVGVWQTDAARCSAPTDSFLMITADAFEQYEDHCRIPETAFVEGGLRGGLECFQEGEEYTKDVTVVLSSDNTLTFNGETYFRCADNSSVP